MRNIGICLSYDGTDFHGWQVQDSLRTVQGVLKDAVNTVTKEEVSLIGCGRTDTGVHARRYVASFKTNCTIPTSRIPAALNSILPHDISVREAKEVSDRFHPIASCLRKEYTYEIYNTPYPDPFLSNYALHFRGDLDLPLLSSAAKHFEGEHDFASMRSLGTDVKSTVRCVHSFRVVPMENGVKMIICANGFLYNMARTMVGTLLSVARGKIQSDEIPHILASLDRSRAGATAPPQGLYMTDVIYDEEI